MGRLPDLAAALQCTVSYLLGLTADPDRWEPNAAGPPALLQPACVLPPARRPQTVTNGPATNSPVANSTVGQGAPPRHGWILGPDLPDAAPPPQRRS